MLFSRSGSLLLIARIGGTQCKKSTLFSYSHLQTLLSSFASSANDFSPETQFIFNYLVDSVGLSPKEASKTSKSIAHIKSPSKPDSVRELLRKNGFSDTEIKKIVFKHPRFLCANIDSTLKPKFEILRDLGFSETQITKMFTSNPAGLHQLGNCNVRARIEFLSCFLDSNDALVKALSNTRCIINCDLEKNIKPKISFLRECQLSDERIGSLINRNQSIIAMSLNSLKSTAKRVAQLGVPCGSKMFYHAFYCLCCSSSDMVDARIKLLGSLGFSSSEVLCAVSRQPNILCFSEKKLCETVDFLVNKVGLKLSYLSRRPSIICLSLVKRLVPRYYVLQLIQKNGLLQKRDFYGFVVIPEKSFVEEFIFSLKEKMPELHDIYLSACVGKFLN